VHQTGTVHDVENMRVKESSATDRLASDIDPDLLGCLRTQVNSFVKWDLVYFFHRNPYTIDTAEGIARHIGRNIEGIQADLAELTLDGILVEHRFGEMVVYAYSEVASVRNMIRRLIEASGDQLFRAKAVFQMIRAMRDSDASFAAADSVVGKGHGENEEEESIAMRAQAH
jgi:hypothetical protein